MGRLGSGAEIGILMQALQRAQDPYLVAQIAWSLGRIGDPGAIAPLLGLAGNKDAAVRDTTADALARIASAMLNNPALGFF
jgi:HEAT repeat protein